MSATNRGAVRRPQDRYYTPRTAVIKFLHEVDFDKYFNLLEPAAGDGRIVEEAQKLAPLVPYREIELDRGEDYLQVDLPHDTYFCITNPPYSLALTFVRKALKECASVAMLLRLGFLESKIRQSFWQANPLTHLYVLSSRPSFTGGSGTDASAYGWFVWRGEFMRRPPGIYVL